VKNLISLWNIYALFIGVDIFALQLFPFILDPVITIKLPSYGIELLRPMTSHSLFVCGGKLLLGPPSLTY
jgi:hypothetical protein